jgi:hypothetical protein
MQVEVMTNLEEPHEKEEEEEEEEEEDTSDESSLPGHVDDGGFSM